MDQCTPPLSHIQLYHCQSDDTLPAAKMQLFLPHLSRGLLQYDSVFPHMQVTRGGPQMCHAWRGHDGINPPLDERASPWKATSSFSTPYLSSKQVSSVPVHTYVSMMFVLYRVRNISHFYT